MVEIMKADRFDASGPTTVNSHPLAMSNPPGISRAPLHPSLHHSHHPGQNSSGSTTGTMSGSGHQGSPLQRPPSTIHHQAVSINIQNFNLSTLLVVIYNNMFSKLYWTTKVLFRGDT